MRCSHTKAFPRWLRLRRKQGTGEARYFLYEMARILVFLVPVASAYWVGRWAGFLFFWLAADRRRIALDNFSHVLGKGQNDPEVRRTARRCFEQFGMYFVDFLRMGRLGKEEVLKFVDVHGRENMDRAVARGKGVVALTAHLGNWELGGVMLALMGYRVHAIALAHQDPRVDRMFVKRRAERGIKVIPVGVAIKRSFSAIRKGDVIALLGDRDLRAQGVHTTFFGWETTVPRGAAVLALRTGAAVVPGFAVRDETGRYQLHLEEAIIPCAEEESIEEFTDRMLRVLESYIRRYPDQWFMFHRMWPDRGTGGAP